jgi:hypothetical protein
LQSDGEERTVSPEASPPLAPAIGSAAAVLDNLSSTDGANERPRSHMQIVLWDSFPYR